MIEELCKCGRKATHTIKRRTVMTYSAPSWNRGGMFDEKIYENDDVPICRVCLSGIDAEKAVDEAFERNQGRAGT